MKSPDLYNDPKLKSFKEASLWASQYLNRLITPSNIAYLVQYGRITKHGSNGSVWVHIDELKQYYDTLNQQNAWKKKLGDDLNWHLSFDQYRESERTKHVHRLHPYKGKFIPQLVEYFLDDHTDEYKTSVYFQPGDIVLDPFCGSGTTLVQSNELGLHAVGIDVSEFNALISNIKVMRPNLSLLKKEISAISKQLSEFVQTRKYKMFDQHVLRELSEFNSIYFPSPQYKRDVRSGKIQEKNYAEEKENLFRHTYQSLLNQYRLKIVQPRTDTFIDTWFLHPVREEIDFTFDQVKEISDPKIKKIAALILSRTIRSCRATTHADLGTLKEPVTVPYYCKKHGKICKPLFTLQSWWERYCIDTLKRFEQFNKIKTDTDQYCITGDSRNVDLYAVLKRKHKPLYHSVHQQKIRGIFSSPPYVGMINYHEQHAYSYDLFGFHRHDELEIGPLYKGQGKEARQSYIRGISDVLLHCKPYLQPDYDIFLVSNDKYGLYPEIAALSGMRIVNQYKRPVLNRVEKDRSNAYSEIIFHLKESWI